MKKMKVPKHIGVIPDGNRRWARAQGFRLKKGYDEGVQRGIKLVEDGFDLGVEEITAYGFTKENAKRTNVQTKAFIAAITELIDYYTENRNGISVSICGDPNSKIFPSKLKELVNIPHTRDKKINVLANYGYEWDLSTTPIQSHRIPRVELLVRWGGRCRLSGFLPLQAAYADIYVVNALWPDASKMDLVSAFQWYAEQDPTMGG